MTFPDLFQNIFNFHDILPICFTLHGKIFPMLFHVRELNDTGNCVITHLVTSKVNTGQDSLQVLTGRATLVGVETIDRQVGRLRFVGTETKVNKSNQISFI